MRIPAALLLLPFAAAAQVPRIPPVAPESVAPILQELATVAGGVFNALTGAPLRKALVQLNGLGPAPRGAAPLSYSATTDSGGRFAFSSVQPETYRVTVTRAGFVAASPGANDPSRPSGNLTIGSGEQRNGLNFRLLPQGIIAGRILDEDNEPLPNAVVYLMRYRYQQGRKQLTTSSTANTNDLGEYRLFGLAPGRYIVSTNVRSGMPGNRQSEEDYIPTFYPGVAGPEAAAPIQVAAGSLIPGIDIRVMRTTTVHVRGRVTGPTPGRLAQVILMPGNQTVLAGGVRSRSTDARGTFDLPGVAPGPYILHATITENGRMHSARITVHVGSANIENIEIALGPGVLVTGAVRVDGKSGEALPPGLSVRLRPRTVGGFSFNPLPSARVSPDGTFRLPDVPQDAVDVVLSPMLEGWYVKSIRSGEVDVLASGLETVRGAAAPIEIVLSPRAGAASGTVQDAATGRPAPGAIVVFVPREAERREQSRYYATAKTGGDGGWAVKSLIPGDYRVLAFEEVESDAWMDAEFLKPFEDKGETVSVREGERSTLALALIPAVPAPPAR